MGLVAEAAPSWDPKLLLLALHPLPSPSLRFQYNFQLTSMSIEQVGRLDCWPITGNHSAPQLSPPSGKGGWGMEREQASNLQAGKGLQAEGREPAAAPHSLTHTYPWAGSTGKGGWESF